MQVREQIDSAESTLKTIELYLVSSGSALEALTAMQRFCNPQNTVRLRTRAPNSTLESPNGEGLG